MPPVSRILVPVVFSDNCRGALRYAVTLASRFGAELTILHVLEPLVCFETESAQALEYIEKCRRDWAQRQMKTLAFTMGARSRIAIRTELVEGDPARRIVGFAAGDESDLIVMATHGHGPFRRFLLGSVTAKVLHDSACPVWTGAHLEEGLKPEHIEISHVLCAINSHERPEHSDTLIRWAGVASTVLEASLTVLHIVADGDNRDYAESQLRKRCEAASLSPEIRVETGIYPGGVCDAAARLNAGLLVVGRGHSDYSLLHRCGSPVLSIAVGAGFDAPPLTGREAAKV